MTKKKKKVDLPPPPPALPARFPDFSPQFKEDLGWWYKTNPSKVDKIFALVTDVMQHPFEGVGKPEPLKHLDADTWSRRIDLEHRLIYRIAHDRVDFLQARYHY